MQMKCCSACEAKMIQINIIDAGHGDCILLDINHFKILIDCGPKTFIIRNNVLARLTSLVGEHGAIDIAIVTHSDDDHIGGFEYLLDSSIKIKTIIFNGLQDIPDIVNDSTVNISYKQDYNLRKRLLEEKEIELKTLIRSSDPLIFDGIKITSINPTIEILEKMLNDSDAKKEREEEKKRQKQISSSDTYEVSVKDAFEKIKSNQDVFTKDTSITNKSSISLIVEYGEFAGLFLGDAHADDIIEGLKSKGLEGHKFDVVKLSHHGSERNTNIELLKLIGKTEYVLCANNEKKHKHPNNLVLARVLSVDENPTIHLSSNNSDLSDKIKECQDLGFRINETYPLNGVNRICYEYK